MAYNVTVGCIFYTESLIFLSFYNYFFTLYNNIASSVDTSGMCKTRAIVNDVFIAIKTQQSHSSSIMHGRHARDIKMANDKQNKKQKNHKSLC